MANLTELPDTTFELFIKTVKDEKCKKMLIISIDNEQFVVPEQVIEGFKKSILEMLVNLSNIKNG
jgi:hypothetical protein